MIRARNLVENASDAAFAVNGNLQILAWNRGARDLLGYSAREAIGRRCYDVLQAVLPGGEPLCTPTCEASLCFARCQPLAVHSCSARHKDGRWVPVSISTIVMPKNIGPPPANSAVAVVLLRVQQKALLGAPLDQPVRIFTLGRFGLAAGGRGLGVEKWERKQASTLLKYLVTYLGRPVTRERLIECLWPEVDESHGRERLKVTVYFLRRQLRAAGVQEEVVATVGAAYVLKREAVWVDAEAFEQLVAEAFALERGKRPDETLGRFEEAQHLYRGDYLEADLYADWCAEERERLREVYLEMLAGMSKSYADRGDYARAAQVCRVALVRDPCRESFHRVLMEHLVRLGRPDWAISQFHHCRRVLAEELGMEPMPDTQRVYHRVLDSRKGGEARVTTRATR